MGNDHLRGGKGDDYIEGYVGHDRINGRPGNDVIVDVQFRNEGERDQIVCGRGHDEAFVDDKDKVADDCEVVRRNAVP